MKFSEIKPRFPMLGFSHDMDLWGFPNRQSLTECGPRSLRDKLHQGLELIDARGRRYRVNSVTRLGRAGSLGRQIFRAMLFSGQLSVIELELEQLTSVELPEVKDRVCAAIDAHPLYYCEPSEQEEEIPKLIRQIRAKRSIEAIYNSLGLDWFAAY